VIKIRGDVKVSTKEDDVLVQGIRLEDVSQTAANIEHATKVRRKDPRVFLDGIFIYEKKEGMEA
jgi:large subunit ribosomal protein L6